MGCQNSRGYEQIGSGGRRRTGSSLWWMNQWDTAAGEMNWSLPSVWMWLFTWLIYGISDLFKTDETRCGTQRLYFTQRDKVNLWYSSFQILFETFHFCVWDFSPVSQVCVYSRVQIYVGLKTAIFSFSPLFRAAVLKMEGENQSTYVTFKLYFIINLVIIPKKVLYKSARQRYWTSWQVSGLQLALFV